MPSTNIRSAPALSLSYKKSGTCAAQVIGSLIDPMGVTIISLRYVEDSLNTRSVLFTPSECTVGRRGICAVYCRPDGRLSGSILAPAGIRCSTESLSRERTTSCSVSLCSNRFDLLR
jgi:hypothetical protein